MSLDVSLEVTACVLLLFRQAVLEKQKVIQEQKIVHHDREWVGIDINGQLVPPSLKGKPIDLVDLLGHCEIA